ncbi:hypothetical protein GYMLUDRAFT_42498 [Collybiopsis luxurians FD-317 M1]|uniref:Uncharacterized protein n=1 Tax=Collybiopsis luxurians FD-317 M1 TaxID=944289 RepID=A0A0D0CS37_9AGAR|nr:hypothetical protein GYMLUDRAFT_42498 [Collybiopsis luxurians FD-317 M1]
MRYVRRRRTRLAFRKVLRIAFETSCGPTPSTDWTISNLREYVPKSETHGTPPLFDGGVFTGVEFNSNSESCGREVFHIDHYNHLTIIPGPNQAGQYITVT